MLKIKPKDIIVTIIAVIIILGALFVRKDIEKIIEVSGFTGYQLGVVCKNDNSELRITNEYCSNCGERAIDTAVLLSFQKTYECADCGQKVAIRKRNGENFWDRYCTHCGSKFTVKNMYSFKENGYESISEVYKDINNYLKFNIAYELINVLLYFAVIILLILYFKIFLVSFTNDLQNINTDSQETKIKGDE